MRAPRSLWSSGNLSTAFIPEEFPEGFKGVPLTSRLNTQLAAIATAMHVIRYVVEEGPFALAECGRMLQEGGGAGAPGVRVWRDEATNSPCGPY